MSRAKRQKSQLAPAPAAGFHPLPESLPILEIRYLIQAFGGNVEKDWVAIAHALVNVAGFATSKAKVSEVVETLRYESEQLGLRDWWRPLAEMVLDRLADRLADRLPDLLDRVFK